MEDGLKVSTELFPAGGHTPLLKNLTSYLRLPFSLVTDMSSRSLFYYCCREKVGC